MKASPEKFSADDAGSAVQPAASWSMGTLSIRTRLLVLGLGLLLIALVIVIATAVESSRSVIRQAQQITSDSLRNQAESYLVQINNSVAGQSALILDRAARDIQSVADASSALFSEQMNMPGTYVGMTVGPDRQLMNSAEDISSVFVPNVTWINTDYNPELYRAVQRDIELSSYLDLTLPSVKDNNPNAGAIYLGTVNDVTRYYPNIRLGEVVPPDFQVTKRPWYTTALEFNAGREKVEPIWSPVYFDATGLGLVTTIAVPVYTQAKDLVGVVGLDITLAEVQRQIENSSFLETGYSFLVDESGNAIILPVQGYQDMLGRSPNPEQPTPNLLQETDNETFQAVLKRMVAGEQGFSTLSLGDRELYIAYTPVRSSTGGEMIIPGWSLASVVAADDVLANVAGLQTELNRTTRQVLLTRILPIGALAALILVAAVYVGTNRMVNPILKLADSAKQLGTGDWEGPVPVLNEVRRKNHDEIGLLAGTLSTMASQLRQTFGQLEQRVADRTLDLERRSLQLQTAADVAGRITLAQNLDQLLDGAVNLICDRFGYYNVGIFLIDETNEYAYLKAASGEAGRKLVDRQIRLRVGGDVGQGIVGYVTRFGQARIAGDVVADKQYVFEPMLSEVRSELTLPLRSGPKIIGALDVQSTQPMAFSEDDATVLQTLADQLATAIENVRLVARMKSSVEETRLHVQQEASRGWRNLLAQVGQIGYEYDCLEVRPLANLNPTNGGHSAQGAASQSPKSDRLLQIPVSLHGQVIGMIGLESDHPDHSWTADELAIAEATANQAAVSIENARLLAESRRLAAREQVTAEVTSCLRESLDMQSVLQSAARAIAEQLNIAEVTVDLNPDFGDDPAQILTGDSVDPPELTAASDLDPIDQYPAAPDALVLERSSRVDKDQNEPD